MHIKSKKTNIFLKKLKKIIHKGFFKPTQKNEKNLIKFYIFMQFSKKDANFEVNIAKIHQITKFID